MIPAGVLTSEEFGSQRDSTTSPNPQLVFILLPIVTAGLTINAGGQRSGGFSASARRACAPLLVGQDQTDWNRLPPPPEPLLPFPARGVNSNNNGEATFLNLEGTMATRGGDAKTSSPVAIVL